MKTPPWALTLVLIVLTAGGIKAVSDHQDVGTQIFILACLGACWLAELFFYWEHRRRHNRSEDDA